MRVKSLTLFVVLLLSFAFPLTPALASSSSEATQVITVSGNKNSEWKEVAHRQLQRGFELIVLANEKGGKVEIVRKVVQRGTSGIVFFWLVRGEEELRQVLAIPEQSFTHAYDFTSQNPQFAQSKGLEILGSHSLPYGGWVWWDSSQVVIYISHGMVVDLLLICGIGAFISAIMSVIGAFLLPPYGWVPGAVWVALWGAGAAYLQWLDSKNGPGFYIIARDYHVFFVP